MYVGVDVGGTNLAVCLVTPDAVIAEKTTRPTLPERDPEAIVADIRDMIRQVSRECASDIRSVGVGIPGVVDNKAGRVIHTANMPFDDLPLIDMLAWDGPVFLENDANAAALGEYRSGAAQGVSSMVMVTLGTGIGGGFILGGRIVAGVGGAAAEVGHMTVNPGGLTCSCGRRGCWEMYASARALISMTADALRANPDSLILQCLHGNPPHISGRTAFEAARQGDPSARAVVETYIDWLAEGLLNIIALLQPEILCIGGGISGEGEGLMAPLRERVGKRRFCGGILQTEIRKAALGNDAGLIGAALLGNQ